MGGLEGIIMCAPRKNMCEMLSFGKYEWLEAEGFSALKISFRRIRRL
jgi:hypothetical protein